MQTDDGIKVVRRLISELRDVHLVKPGDVSESAFAWLVGWFTGDERVKSGRALTELMWLPQAYWACLAQAIKGEGGYTSSNAMDLGLFVTFEALRGCDVQIGEKRIPTSLSVGVAKTSGTYEVKKLYKKVARGETITLPAAWAIHAMMQHSMYGWEPRYWESSSATPKTECLREVGYELRGSVAQVTSPPPQARRKAS